MNALLIEARECIESSRLRFEAQARRCRLLADSADPVFRRQYLDLADSIDSYLEELERQQAQQHPAAGRVPDAVKE
ncbi:MAG: hypothetical protein AB7I36_07160 [Rhodospirillaceae bacterium]